MNKSFIPVLQAHGGGGGGVFGFGWGDETLWALGLRSPPGLPPEEAQAPPPGLLTGIADPLELAEDEL